MNNWTGAGSTNSGAAWEGTYSLAMSSSGTAYQDVPTHGGEPLTFSGMVKTSGVSGTGAYYKIDYYDASNNLITGVSVQANYATGTQDWTRLSMIATAPSNANHARVQCILNGSGTAYFDDVKLIPRNSERYTYDASGNYMVASEDALGNQSQHTYDSNVGNVLSFSDPLNHTTAYGYDGMNRLTQVTDPSYRTSYYQYDPVSNLIYTRDPRSSSSSDNTYSTYYGPNSLNQLSTLTDPLSQSVTYTYDRSGNLTGVSLPNGMSESLTYDNANRLTRETLSNGTYYNFSYDGAGELTGVTDQNGASYSWNYDGTHRVTSTTDPFSYTLNYQWDKGNKLTSLGGGDYGNCQYAYASDGKLPSMTLPDGSVIYYNYDENGHVFHIRYPGSCNERNIVYASNGWLTQIQDTGFPGYYNYNYGYNSDGTISWYNSWAGADSFSYDADGRLTYWYYSPSSLSGGSAIQQNYSYDAAGNMTNKGGTARTYNSANEITNTGFTYDQNGNLTSDGTFTYAYNSLDQLVQVNKTSDNSLVASYTYNHNGLRRSKTVSGQTTNYDWDASGNLVRESTPGSGNYYYYTPSGKLVGFKKSGTTYIVHDNQRGDIESVTTESGSIVAQYHFDPWGNQIAYSGSVTLPFGYAGYYYDAETSLYYLKNRYYSPALGRFLTRDTHDNIDDSDPQTLNLYSYAGNNPINHVDPDGNGYVWNNFGEIIGTTSGADYTDNSKVATDTHGGSQYANTPWNGNSETFYAKISGPSITGNGKSVPELNRITADAGLGKSTQPLIKNVVNVTAGGPGANLAINSKSLEADAHLASVGGDISIPLPFTKKKIVIGGEIDFVDLGAGFSLKKGFSARLGFGLGFQWSFRID